MVRNHHRENQNHHKKGRTRTRPSVAIAPTYAVITNAITINTITITITITIMSHNRGRTECLTRIENPVKYCSYLGVRHESSNTAERFDSLVLEEDAHLPRALWPSLPKHGAGDGLPKELQEVLSIHLDPLRLNTERGRNIGCNFFF